MLTNCSNNEEIAIVLITYLIKYFLLHAYRQEGDFLSQSTRQPIGQNWQWLHWDIVESYFNEPCKSLKSFPFLIKNSFPLIPPAHLMCESLPIRDSANLVSLLMDLQQRTGETGDKR